jgi:hypothetical protein
MARNAQCECGSFKVVVDVEPAATGICSCINCQRRSGSVFGAIAYFPKGGVRMVSGQHKTFVRSGESGGNLHQHFCSECGTTVLVNADFLAGLSGVPIGCFADPTFPPPQVALYDRTRHPWVTLPKDLPAFPSSPSIDEIAAILAKQH